MIEIREVKTKKEIKQFIMFPIKMYWDNKNYIPPIILDEMETLDKNKKGSFEVCDAIMYSAFIDGVMVGRIMGIIQNDYNKINGTKTVRFSRFHCIDDQEVANALFSAVEEWAKEKGMDKIIGPLGFNDLDREGLLIEGFDEKSTYESEYNADYYGKLIENYGFVKDVDWVEFRIKIPNSVDPRYERVGQLTLKKYNLHEVKMKSTSKLIDTYEKRIFNLIDECYMDLYGVVPYSEKVRMQIVKSFKLVLNTRYVSVVVDENDRVVGFGLVLCALADAVQKSHGKLLPLGIFRMLKAKKHPKEVDLALIAVDKEYQRRGLPAIMFNAIMKNLIEDGIEFAETNLNLEDNVAIQANWKNFEHRQHKRRRSYIKQIN